MRVDQDIHFTVRGVPVHMRLDTTAPGNQFLLRPEREEDKRDPFAKAVRDAIAPHFAEGSVFVSDDHATVIDDDSDSTISTSIFASLPEWDGQSLKGLSGKGAEDLASFLGYLRNHAQATEEFFRSNGSRIEFE